MRLSKNEDILLNGLIACGKNYACNFELDENFQIISLNVRLKKNKLSIENAQELGLEKISKKEINSGFQNLMDMNKIYKYEKQGSKLFKIWLKREHLYCDSSL